MKLNQSRHGYITALMFICIFCLGAYVRFSGLYDSIWSSAYDETRDTIVASHFVNYGERLMRGTNASTPYLLNPPTYYYFVSGLFYIGGSIWGAKLLWASILTLTVVCAYVLGVLVWDKKLGLINAFLVAIHPTFVIPMQLISQTMLPPLLVFLLLICLFQRKQTIVSLSLTIWFLFLGLHTHYSMFVVLPFIGIWWIILYVSYIRTHKAKQTWKRYIPAATGIIGLCIWLFLSYQSSPFDQLAITKTGNTQSMVAYISQICFGISEYLYLLFYRYFQPYSILAIIVILGLVGSGMWSIYVAKRFIYPKIGYLLLLVGLNIFPFFLVGKFTGTIYAAYFLLLLPIGVFTVALMLRSIVLKLPYVGVFLLVVCLGYYARVTLLEMKNRPSISYYEITKQGAEAIYKDNALVTYPHSNTYPFTLRFAQTDNNVFLNEWQTGGFWFHLESITKEKLVVLKETGADFESIEQDPQYTYIICDGRTDHNETIGEGMTCEHIKNTLQEQYQQVLFLIYQNFPYTIWRMDRGVKDL